MTGDPGPKRGGGGGAAARDGLEPGLYLVATPIGNARDITLRALDVLKACDAIAAEDTRVTQRLMEIHGIARSGRPMIPYHDRNAGAARSRIEEWLREGLSVAYCTDAGTPLVADPGYRLVRLAAEGGHSVTALPGPSAALAALSLSGLPTDRFMFAGFPPSKPAARRRFLTGLAGIEASLVLFESPHRVVASLSDMAEVLGPEREAALARELTKRFETVRRMPLGVLAETLAVEGPPKGEIVVVIGPPGEEAEPDEKDLDSALRHALSENSVKDAARLVSAALGVPRKEAYTRALALAADKGFGEN